MTGQFISDCIERPWSPAYWKAGSAADEPSAALIFLASDASTYVIGITLPSTATNCVMDSLMEEGPEACPLRRPAEAKHRLRGQVAYLCMREWDDQNARRCS